MQTPHATTLLVDDFSDPRHASNGHHWRFFSDAVMGGVSEGYARHETVAGRPSMHLMGEVSLEHNGGFIQMALDLAEEGKELDASHYSGIAATVLGDGGRYAVNLRSSDVRRPWQSYRCEFKSRDSWTTYHLPFEAFLPHRIACPLAPDKLRRVGLIAIGRPGRAELAVSRLEFYRQSQSA